MKKRVVISMSVACKELKTTFPTVNGALKNLEKLGIVKEMSGRKRHRLFAYYPYLKVLQQGTDAPAG